MSEFSRFMKQNKKKREPAVFAVTRSLVDEDGEPLVWAFQPISTRENEAIREDCMVEVASPRGGVRTRLNTAKYMTQMICATVKEPNLYDKQLQDSYGVMTAEELLKEMVDHPGEYMALSGFVQEINGFTTLEEKVKEAKN